MEKQKSSLNLSFVTHLKETMNVHPVTAHSFEIYPQMPSKQISHFAKQIVDSNKLVAIQANTSTDQVSEFIGFAKCSYKSSQLIIVSPNTKISYLIRPKDIRHIRYI